MVRHRTQHRFQGGNRFFNCLPCGSFHTAGAHSAIWIGRGGCDFDVQEAMTLCWVTLFEWWHCVWMLGCATAELRRATYRTPSSTSRVIIVGRLA